MALDKSMLIGALKNDQNFLQEQINEATKVGKLIGKVEFVSGLISVLEKGNFDFFSKEEGQKVVESQMDENSKSLKEEVLNVVSEVIED